MRPGGIAKYRHFLKAVVVVHLIRVSLRWLGFARTIELVGRVAPPPSGGHEGRDAATHPMVWAVRAAGRRTLRERPCLPTALALLVFLRRSGIPAELRIGVERPESTVLSAHAWVESEGSVVLGGTASPRHYRPFSTVAVGDGPVTPEDLS